MIKIKYILLHSVLFLCCANLSAQTIYTTVPTTVATFLRTPTDIIQSGMGNAGIATEAVEYATLNNIAKAPFSKSVMGFGVTYSPWLTDIGANGAFFTSLSGFKQLSSEHAFSFAFIYNGLGRAQFADANGNNLDEFNTHELSFEGGYSRKLNDNMALGFTFKYINSALGKGTVNNVTYKAGDAVAGDVSFLYRSENSYNDVFALGVILSNLGNKVSYTSNGSKSFLPANLGIGASYKFNGDSKTSITIAGDVNKLLVPAIPKVTNHYKDDSIAMVSYTQKSVPLSWVNSFADGSNQLSDLHVACGLEYGIAEKFFFRFGYSYEGKSVGGNKYFTTGLGGHFGSFGADAAYVIPSGTGLNRSPLANTVRLGINILLGNDDK